MTEFNRYYDGSIELTADHRKLARRLTFRWDEDVEWGAIEIDAKRPFGNSDMPRDVAEILGWDLSDDDWEPLSDEQTARAIRLHYEMGYVLKSLVEAWVSMEGAT